MVASIRTMAINSVLGLKLKLTLGVLVGSLVENLTFQYSTASAA